jgi:nucleoid-associated protein YgaU
LIIKGSRYVETSETRNEDTKVIATASSFATDSYQSVITQQNETFASLASDFLNNPNLYWKIADINKDLGYPDVLPAGTTVRVPFK